MQDIDDSRKEAMGQLHNEIVVLVDGTILTPFETVMVLRIVINEIEKVFEQSVKGQ